MNNPILKLTLLFAIGLFAFDARAQKDKNLEGDNVTIVKEFEAYLDESNKISVTPVLPPLDTSTKRQNYLVPPKPLAVVYDAPKLRPIAMKTGQQEKPFHGFAKLGGGIPASLWGEAGYGFDKNEKFDGKVWFRHHNLNASKSIDNQRFFNTDGLINANVYLQNNMAVEGRVGYSFDRYHFYGYDHEAFTFTPKEVQQDYKILDLGARLYNSTRSEMDLNYSAGAKYYRMDDFEGNEESGFDLNLAATKWFAEKHPLRIAIRTDLTSFSDTDKVKLNNIYLQPSFTFHNDFLKFKVGGNFASNRDEFSVFPDAELALRVWGDGIQIFGGASGDLRKNTYRSISEYNPFIQIREETTRLIRNTRYDNYYAGVKGDLGWLEYSGQAGWSKASDLALYLPMFLTNGLTRFRVLYDTAQIFNLQGTVKLTPIKNLTVTGTLSQNVFEMSNEKSAWGLPGLEGNFNGNYNLLDGKAALRANLYIADRIARIDDQNIRGKDGALLDLGFGGTYYFSKNIGAFLDINNLLNNTRERWHNYPMVGLNFLGGITARF